MSIFQEIREEVERELPDKVILLTDTNVAEVEEALIAALAKEYAAPLVVTPAGEEHKGVEELLHIVEALEDAGATRKSLLMCIGGGMVTDIGGFAAAIFKRGIRHLNVATTILGAVDASVGGKTGIDFSGLKNQLGAFHLPVAVLVDAESFSSLPDSEILSGWGEVIKTALITDEGESRRLLGVNPLEADTAELARVCTFCRDAKMRVTQEDPTEKGLRKILNFGHTAGHAIESLMLEKGNPLPHGSAVAHGILVAMILSNIKKGLASQWVTDYAQWLRKYYPSANFTCRDYPRLLEIAHHDKKNVAGGDLSFVLLTAPGCPEYDCGVRDDEFSEALDIYQELMGR